MNWSLLIIPYMSLADRMRGGMVEPDQLGGLMMGLGVAWAVKARFYWAVPIAALFMLGEAPGWGHPMGCIISGCVGEPEWWEIGLLADNPNLALAFRGLLWALPVLLLTPKYPELLCLLLLTFILPLSLNLAVVLPVDNPWALSEWIRGALLGSVLYVVRRS